MLSTTGKRKLSNGASCWCRHRKNVKCDYPAGLNGLHMATEGKHKAGFFCSPSWSRWRTLFFRAARLMVQNELASKKHNQFLPHALGTEAQNTELKSGNAKEWASKILSDCRFVKWPLGQMAQLLIRTENQWIYYYYQIVGSPQMVI